ncbi:hypothetical protein ZHAS_00017284 [Anopheles sinensis]|uniref:Uncharacterized protein n=1 Tax=Anopheles sinensis TaxID=74873 RepID=A0A084WFY6_ANOSI|nr:hypothetical protein ZHAS_00017284 [Anopheles sinensis]
MLRLLPHAGWRRNHTELIKRADFGRRRCIFIIWLAVSADDNDVDDLTSSLLAAENNRGQLPVHSRDAAQVHRRSV